MTNKNTLPVSVSQIRTQQRKNPFWATVRAFHAMHVPISLEYLDFDGQANFK